MAAVDTTQIDLDSTRNFDRTRPLALQPYFSAKQWDALADRVDGVFQPDRGFASFAKGLCIAGPLIGFVLFGIGGFLSVRQSSFSFLIPVGLVFFIGSPLLGYCFLNQISNKWRTKMQRIAQETSNSIKQVSVHYKEEMIPYVRVHNDPSHPMQSKMKCYFEFAYRRGGDVEQPVTATEKLPTVTATVLDTPEYTTEDYYPSHYVPAEVDDSVEKNNKCNKSARERLEELEGLRDILSPAEYKQARNKILEHM